MKKIRFLTLIFSSLFLMFSCDDEEIIVVVPEEGSTVLEADITEIELDRNNTSNPALTLYWSEATYSEQTPVSYRVDVSSTETFDEFIEGGIVTTNTITWSVSQLNGAAAAAGLPPFEWNDLYFRVNSFLGSAQGTAETQSNVVSVNVLTYYNYPVQDLFLVGPACVSGWDNNNNNPVVFRDPNQTDLYHFTGFFNGGQPLKLLEQRGAWAPQYGEGDQGVLVKRTTEADEDPSPINDIESLADGYYTLDLDLNNLTFTIQSFDESNSPDYSSVSVSGSATGGTVDMVQSDFDSHFWQIQSTTLIQGDLQFNVDGTAFGADTEFSGIATEGGGNIPIGVGDDYEIWFNDLTGDYVLIPINLSQS